MRTIYSAPRSPYMDWQAELLARSHRLCGQAGELTRLTADVGPLDGDDYAPYNKPFALRDWLRATAGDGDELLHVIDPDIVYLRPIDEEAAPGSPAAESIFFMGMDVALHRGIVARHARRNAELVQPIGVPLLISKSDLAVFVDRWCELTVEMRATPETRATIPWVCEQWACAIAAAEAGVRFRLVNLQQFPTEPFYGRPLIHYAYDVRGAGRYCWSKRGYAPWATIPPPPDDSAETGRVLWRHLDDAIRDFVGTPYEPPREPLAKTPPPRDPFEPCPGFVCRHGHGDLCRAVATRHWRLCARTNADHPDYDPAFLPLIAPAADPALAKTPPPPPAVDPARIVAIETCDFRRSSCGCLAKPAECLQGGYKAIVGFADCTACLA